MRADFVYAVAKILDIKRKDLLLHQILTDLSKDDFFGDPFIVA